MAVQSWVATIFVPLNFLGGVYATIIQAFIDIRNLLHLLAESPDITDRPGAQHLPVYSAVHPQDTLSVTVHDPDDESAPFHKKSKSEPGGIEMTVGPSSIGSRKSVHAGSTAERRGDQGAALGFHDVCFNYPGQLESQGLSGISFTVAPGR